MSFARSKTATNFCKSPKSQNQSPDLKVRKQKSVAFKDESECPNSASTTYDRLNLNYSPSINDNQNKSSGSIFGSPKKGSQSIRDTPKDLVKTILQRTSDGYVDEDHPETIDKLLQNGFEIVSERKNEKELLLAQRDALEAQIVQAGQAILPEVTRGKQLKEALKEAQGIRLKYYDEIHHLDNEIKRAKARIEARQGEHKVKEEELEAVICKLHDEVRDVSDGIEERRIADKQDVQRLEKKLVVSKEQQKGLNGEIADLKTQLVQMRQYNLARTRMVENKVNNYIGMLQHKGFY